MDLPVCTLTLFDDLTVYHTLAQKNTLLDALKGASTLELDLAQVGEIDTAGLQLLLLVKREAARAGKEVRLTGHSPAVRELIEFAHLAAHFGDPMVITAGEANQ